MGLVYIPFDTTSTISNAVITADKALYQSRQEGKNKIVIKKIMNSLAAFQIKGDCYDGETKFHEHML